MGIWSLAHTFEFEGRAVKYGVAGEGEPLVLVHGTPWSSFNLRHLIKGLSQHYKVYYFDLLGYGESDQSEGDVSLGIQNRLLDALIEHWSLESPYIVGHDFGGTTVLRNHLLDQRSYRKMVVIDPVALSPWGSPFFKHVEKHEEAFAGVPEYIHAAIVEAYVKTAAYQVLDSETMDGILKPWITEQGKPAFYRQIAQADSKFTDEFQDKLSTITTPVLILWGEEDQWIPSEQAHVLSSKIEGSKVVTIPNAGHLIIEEKPTELVAEILDFLAN
ncbi:alpha/beta hydrolase [Marinomonas sp. C2222]|uniref:Alpha/beta hydrolase n=1 Tax=Marinomonas sargassi TaxID=2984494 RepID=A0ABT2YT12_9GAMM|nr:alpha/beta hydrolase [Marinomonas sargassi]MCV2403015.1 alpha/beta hydrolase [Marinomonas sargassi]